MELGKESFHATPYGETASTMSMGESDPFKDIPWWAHWISTAILSLIFVVGLPLNGATVLIFCRRKKLRHLVNYVLLLDCLSHIVLLLLCIPIHLVTEWSGSTFSSFASGAGLVSLQQVIGNFVNLYSTFLTVSIAILRYRRLCWKKKDKFSTVNALKWSVTSGILAIAVIFVQSYAIMLPEGGKTIAIVYLVKISLMLLAVATVFFCYIRVSQRVWGNTANQEKTMDPAKLKKSRSVHLKATIHSCVQIVLVISTITPHLYLQALEMISASSTDPQLWGLNDNFSGEQEQPVMSASQQQLHQHQEPNAEWIDSTLQFSQNHQESLNSDPSLQDDAAFESFSSNNSSRSNEDNTSERGIPGDMPPTAEYLTALGASHLIRLIAITINYALLALGTPCAYIASCHRFREQFTSILFSHVPNSPQNSTCHHHQHGNHQHSSPGDKAHHHRERNHYHQRSTTGDACFASPLTRTDTRTSTTALHHSMISRNSINSNTNGGSASGMARESVSISISANTSNSRSSFSHSFKSKSSLRKGSACGSSMKRRMSSSAGCVSGSKGLLGVSVAADSVFIESESLILDQDDSNGSSSTGKRCTPSQSPTGGEEVSNRGSSGELLHKTSCGPFPLTAVTTITGNSSLHTYLQNYGYDCNPDLGQLV